MRVRVNAVAIAQLLIGIQDACHSCHELAELTGLQVQTVRYYLNTLHSKGIIHICDWKEDARGSRILKVFSLGTGKDVPRPKPMTGKEICARYRAKNKQIKLANIFSTTPQPTQPRNSHEQQAPSQ